MGGCPLLQRRSAGLESIKLCDCAPTAGLNRLGFVDELKEVVTSCNSDEFLFLFLGRDCNCTENPKLNRNHLEPHNPSHNLDKSIVYVTCVEGFPSGSEAIHLGPLQGEPVISGQDGSVFSSTM